MNFTFTETPLTGCQTLGILTSALVEHGSIFSVLFLLSHPFLL